MADYPCTTCPFRVDEMGGCGFNPTDDGDSDLLRIDEIPEGCPAGPEMETEEKTGLSHEL